MMIPNSDEDYKFEDLMDLIYKQEKLEMKLYSLRETIKMVAGALWKQEMKRTEKN